MHGKALFRTVALLAAALAVAAALAALTSQGAGAPAQASSHSAVRSFGASYVVPGGELSVTVVMSGYGAIGLLVETLPPGFAYQGSDLDDAAAEVDDDDNTVTFTLLGEESVTYTVTAPEAEDRYTFKGVMVDRHRNERAVTGASTIRVGPAPTPTPVPPTPTPTPTPTATPTPTPTPTATPTPSPTPTRWRPPMMAPCPPPKTMRRLRPRQWQRKTRRTPTRWRKMMRAPRPPLTR